MDTIEQYKQKKEIKLSNLKPNDIVLLKGSGNYTWVYLANGSKRLLCKTMHSVMDEYEPMFFVRTHKSYSVNLNHFKYQDKHDELTLVLTNGIKAEVSRRKKKDFLSSLSYHNYMHN
jgi:two-component system, LytTR family, response regulator